ncbi:hypothetical protein PENTCL1PPCAC_3813 [Pristionchus entomophagus]|uniref:Uncharacterized protein n=1 Tax=Pristionchus entomophagus TaxID=358040 RepID=A0AAV5SHG9_9BILA|nr:hypothetical protein PENTCL1PPCAC_3813 [Pristionchus entomophagus]
MAVSPTLFARTKCSFLLHRYRTLAGRMTLGFTVEAFPFLLRLRALARTMAILATVKAHIQLLQHISTTESTAPSSSSLQLSTETTRDRGNSDTSDSSDTYGTSAESTSSSSYPSLLPPPPSLPWLSDE